MSEEDTLNQTVKKMRDHFFVPPSPDEAFLGLDELIEKLNPEFQALGQTFRHNLASMLSAVSIPFTLASTSVYQSHFQRMHTAEKIRALKINIIQPDEQIEQVRKREAYRIAESRMKEFEDSEHGKSRMILDTCDFLIASLEESDFKFAARELIQQGMVLSWSAFEILFRDAFELKLNLDPSTVVLLAQNISTRKRFEVDKFSLDTLIEYDFDLSKKLGTILVVRQDFSDLPAIKTISSILFSSCSNLANLLNSSDLWLLYQRRHLFVHRRGIVDKIYLNNTSEAAPLGTALEVPPKDFEKHFSAVLKTGEALLRCFQNDNLTEAR